MIVGIGIDTVNIRRIERLLQRFDDQFTQRCFTEIEQERCNRSSNRAASYAKRFAAKEACSKALGTGIAQGVFWKDMGVINVLGGKPSMVLSGGAEKHLFSIIPKGINPIIHLTISDEFPLAQAFVIIEIYCKIV